MKVVLPTYSLSGCPCSIKVARRLCKMTRKSIVQFIGLVVVWIVLSIPVVVSWVLSMVHLSEYELIIAGTIGLVISPIILVSILRMIFIWLGQTPSLDRSGASTFSLPRFNLRKLLSRTTYKIRDCNYKRQSSTTAAVTNQSSEKIKVNEVCDDQSNLRQESNFSSDSEEENDAALTADGQTTEDTTPLVSPEATDFQPYKSDATCPVCKPEHRNIQRNSSDSLDSGDFSESKEFLCDEKDGMETEIYDQNKGTNKNVSLGSTESQQTANLLYSEQKLKQRKQTTLWKSLDFGNFSKSKEMPSEVNEDSEQDQIHHKQFPMTDVINSPPLQVTITADVDEVKIFGTCSSPSTFTGTYSEFDSSPKHQSCCDLHGLSQSLDLIPPTVTDCSTVSGLYSRSSSVSSDSETDSCSISSLQLELSDERSRSSNHTPLSLDESEQTLVFPEDVLIYYPPIEPLVLSVVNDESTVKLGRSVCSPTTTQSSHIKLEEVIAYLQSATNATAQEEEPEDYASFRQEIFRICSGCDGEKLPLISPASDDPYSILVQGPGVGKVKAELEELTRMCYSKYKITVSDTEPAFVASEGLAVYTNHFVGCDTDLTLANSEKPIFRNSLVGHKTKSFYMCKRNCRLELNEVAEEYLSTIEIFVKDSSLDQVFAVTTASALLTFEEMGNLRAESDHKSIRAICNKIVGRCALDEQLSIKPHNGYPVKVNSPPLISFRHFFNSNEDPEKTMLHQKIMTDIALLPVSREELTGLMSDKKLLPAESNLSLHCSKHINISQDPIGLVAGILDIQDASEIEQLITARTKVFVGGTTGVMEMKPRSFPPRPIPPRLMTSPTIWQMAHSITFTTEKALLRGSSGSAVMVYNKADHMFYAIGILTGKCVRYQQEGKTLYQAMVLAPALKQLEELYPKHIRHGQLNLVCINRLLGSEVKSTLLQLQKCASELLEKYDSGFMSEQGDQQQDSWKEHVPVPYSAGKMNGEICRTEEFRQSTHSSSSQDDGKSLPSHPISQDSLSNTSTTTTTIKRVGTRLWDSVEGDSFEEIIIDIRQWGQLPSAHQDVLKIRKTGTVIWQSADKRRFEKLQLVELNCNDIPGTAAPQLAAESLPIKHVVEARGHHSQAYSSSRELTWNSVDTSINQEHAQNSIVEDDQLQETNPFPPEGNAGSEKTQELDEQKSENLPPETEASCNKDVKVPTLKGYQLEGLIDKLYVDPDERFRGLRKPEDFEAFIDALADKILKVGNIQSAIYMPSPLTYYKVLVQGHGVGRIKEQLKKYVAEHFSQYTIIVSETGLDEHGIPSTTLLGNKQPYHVNISSRGAGAQSSNVSVVTAFIKGKRSQREQITFALSVFHGIGTVEEMKELLCTDNSDGAKTREYCKNVIWRMALKDHITILEPKAEESQQSEIYVRDFPFIAYSHHMKTKAKLEPFQTFLMDFVLLPIDAETLYPPISSEHPAECRFQTCTINIGGALKETRIAGYIDIKNGRDVELLVQPGIAIFVADTKGRIVAKPFHRSASHSSGTAPPEDVDRYIIADHIAIITDDELIKGTSGSPVMVYNEQEDELYILGALTGFLTRCSEVFKRPIYRVAALAPGLRQLEFLYPDYLKDLELIPAPGSKVVSVEDFLSSPKKLVESDIQNLDTGYQSSSSNIAQPAE